MNLNTNTLSFNKDKLTCGDEYDYITRTSRNQGILLKTGFVNQDNINSAGNWSLGLLQMDFFYRNKPWYAGQFIRKIVPNIELSKGEILYFTTLLNKQKKLFLSGLVRDVDYAFLNAKIFLPSINEGIAFDYIDQFIATINAERIDTINAYLLAAVLKNYTLTQKEQAALDGLDTVAWGAFKMEDVLVWQKNISELNPLHLDSLTISEEKKYPFYGQATTNKGIIEYHHLRDDIDRCFYIV